MYRRCAACTELFACAVEPRSPEAYRCPGCQRAGRQPRAAWMEMWERGLALQERHAVVRNLRVVRDDDDAA